MPHPVAIAVRSPKQHRVRVTFCAVVQEQRIKVRVIRVAAVVAPAGTKSLWVYRSKPSTRSPRCHDRHEAVIPHRAVECDRRDAADESTGSGPSARAFRLGSGRFLVIFLLSLSCLLSPSLLLVPELMSPTLGNWPSKPRTYLKECSQFLARNWVAAGWFGTATRSRQRAIPAVPARRAYPVERCDLAGGSDHQGQRRGGAVPERAGQRIIGGRDAKKQHLCCVFEEFGQTSI